MNNINIFDLYEYSKKYADNDEEYDDIFYDSPEGEAQVDIVREMLEAIIKKI